MCISWLFTNSVLHPSIVSKGSSAHLLKARNVRRRSKMEILQAKEETAARLLAEVENQREIERLKQKLEEIEQGAKNLEAKASVVDSMLQQNVIRVNEEGNYALVPQAE